MVVNSYKTEHHIPWTDGSVAIDIDKGFPALIFEAIRNRIIENRAQIAGQHAPLLQRLDPQTAVAHSFQLGQPALPLRPGRCWHGVRTTEDEGGRRRHHAVPIFMVFARGGPTNFGTLGLYGLLAASRDFLTIFPAKAMIFSIFSRQGGLKAPMLKALLKMLQADPRWHLFEFMDLDWLSASLRQVLRDILECGNGRPFRGYYDWAVRCIVEQARLSQARTVVELGAGTAPLTRRLACDPRAQGLELVVCDLNPDLAVYEELEQQYPGRVTALREPVDFSQPRAWPEGTLLVLSATLHHIPASQRLAVLQALTCSAQTVLIFEPLRRTLLSALFVGLSLVPALVVPLAHLGRPGRWRRVLWCWLVPVAPLMFVWDGLVSCWRQWTARQWEQAIQSLFGGRIRGGQVAETLFCQQVVLRCGKN